MNLVRAWLLTLIVVILSSLFVVPTLQYTTTAQSQSDTVSITLLYPSDDSGNRDEFTIRADDNIGIINLNTLNFRWNDGSNDRRFNLSDQPRIRSAVQNARSGECIQFYRVSANSNVPLCNNVISQPVTPAEVFWEQQSIVFDVFQGDTFIRSCSTATDICSFNWLIATPSPTATHTIPVPTRVGIGEVTPADSPGPSPTLSLNPATTLATNGVSSNSLWEAYSPYIQDFNGVEMVLVPVGCFQFSVDATSVCFDMPFWIGRYEVTNGQMNASGCTDDINLPRSCITWDAAQNYCAALGARLPTEAEWEYAARGPDNLLYPWGNTFVADNVWYDDNSRDVFRVGFTSPVGTRPGGAAWVGAHDMSGNVWEWVGDSVDTNDDNRILRGGSRGNDPNELTTSIRLIRSRSFSEDTIGFRCARDVSPSDTPSNPTVVAIDDPTPSDTPQDFTPAPSPTLSHNDVPAPNLILYSTDNSLTLYINSDNPVSLVGFRYQTTIDAGSDERFTYNLGEWDALSINDQIAQPRICYILERQNSPDPLPIACQGTPHRLTLSNANIFWYDSNTRLRRSVAILAGDTRIAICPASDVGCEITYYSATTNEGWLPIFRVFREIEMALVPSGCFMMGFDNYDDNEMPVHEQCFDAPFWIDRTEVTRGQYNDCVAAGECPLPTPNEYSTTPNQPINNISWIEARDYCAWRDARLPTEREWEYVARGPNSWAYPWDNELDEGKMVWGNNSGNRPNDVGSRPDGASWVGAVDMSGNVWEWVNSLVMPYPYNANDGRENIDNLTDERGIRGGSYYDYIPDFRAANRDGDIPTTIDLTVGFRCARDFDGRDLGH